MTTPVVAGGGCAALTIPGAYVGCSKGCAVVQSTASRARNLVVSRQLRIERHRWVSNGSLNKDQSRHQREADSERTLNDGSRYCENDRLTLCYSAKPLERRWTCGLAVLYRSSCATNKILDRRRNPRTIHEKPRYFTSQPVLSLSSRGKPTAVKHGLRLPQYGPSGHGSKPKLPSSTSNNTRSVPGRIRTSEPISDELLISVKNEDVYREKRAREASEDQKGWFARRYRIESEISDSYKEIFDMSATIVAEMKEARLLGKVDFRTIPHRKISAESHRITAELREILQALKKAVYAVQWQAQLRLDRREQSAYEEEVSFIDNALELSSTQILALDVDYQTLVSKIQRMAQRHMLEELREGIPMYEKAANVLIIKGELKDPSNSRFQTAGGLATLRIILVDTDSYIQKLRQEKQGRVAQKLERISWIIRMMTAPFQPNTPHKEWHLEVAQIAHQIRELELSIRSAEYLPEITFAHRWATSIRARYVWPLLANTRNLKLQSIGLFECTVLQERLLSSNRSNRRRHVDMIKFSSIRHSKLKNLSYLILSSARQTEKICELFNTLIGDGYNSLCPHPNKTLHRTLSKTFRLYEELDTNMEHLVHDANTLGVELDQVCAEGATSLSKTSKDLRQGLSMYLDHFLNLPQDTGHLLSRRGDLSNRYDLLIWRGARLLYGMHDPANGQGFASTLEARDARIKQPLSSPSKPPALDSGHKMSGTWLTNQSLYPKTAPIMIDFVNSRATFQQVVHEVLQHEVIGIDVVTSLPGPLNAPRATYILMASVSNIYIIDVLAVRAPAMNYFNGFLRRILEDESVLKICMDTKRLAQIFWDDAVIDLKGVYDLAHHRVRTEPTGFPDMGSLLVKQFHVSDDFVQAWLVLHSGLIQQDFSTSLIYHLALRCYAPLRLFSTLDEQRVIRTTDTLKLFNIANFSQLVRQSNIQEAELGPINVDRGSHAFEKDFDLPCVKGQSISTARRQNWMREASVNMAHDHLSKIHISPLRLQNGLDQAHLQAARNGLAAYYLATVFNETLHTIENYLGLKDAAMWILWVAEKYSLRLNTDDRDKYRKSSEIPQPSLKDLVWLYRPAASTAATALEDPKHTRSRVAMTYRRNGSIPVKVREHVKSPPSMVSSNRSNRILGTLPPISMQPETIPNTARPTSTTRRRKRR